MKNTRAIRSHTQQSPEHGTQQMAPAFRSPDTAPAVAALLGDRRNAVLHHGREAQARRQDAEEQLRHIASREQLIAEKEREITSIREEITRINTAARNANSEADRHTRAQQEAELAVQDLETVLSVYAPAALELATPTAGTPPNGTPADGAHPDTTGGYATAVAGSTGPQQVPAPQQGH